MPLWKQYYPIRLDHSLQDFYGRKLILFHFRYFVLGSHDYSSLGNNLTCTMLNANYLNYNYLLCKWFIFYSIACELIKVLNLFNFISIRNPDIRTKMWEIDSKIIWLVIKWEKTHRKQNNCLPGQMLQIVFKVWSQIYYNFHMAVK